MGAKLMILPVHRFTSHGNLETTEQAEAGAGQMTTQPARRRSCKSVLVDMFGVKSEKGGASAR